MNMKLIYIANNDTLMISARDYLMLNHVNMNLGTGVLETVTGSVKDPSYPAKPKTVRGEAKIIGMRLTPSKRTETELITISMIDPRGRIPKKMRINSGEQQATRVRVIANTFKNRFNQ